MFIYTVVHCMEKIMARFSKLIIKLFHRVYCILLYTFLFCLFGKVREREIHKVLTHYLIL